ncbi:hypothetical protein CKA32_004861 [Geitlerinema sp. FC II]|nr:hypothetical protein CKA32_004861 [Geitlerinema sp. FC II]
MEDGIGAGSVGGVMEKWLTETAKNITVKRKLWRAIASVVV